MEEKRLKFTELYISNFRNITEKTIKFNDSITKIEGENGLGKTNILSSILWCLFGKNIYDVKQFPISPIIDGVEDNTINTIVRLTINDNYVIERSYKDRKAVVKTGWIIDGKTELVAITQTKYQEELKENFIDEETFKSLSNINYVPSLHWKDLKQLIFELIGNIDDTEVLLRADFKLIEEYVRKFGIDETQRLLKNTDSELKDDIERLEIEYQTLLNTKDKYVVSDEDNTQLIARKEEITNQLNSVYEENKKYIEHQEKINNKQNELTNLTNNKEKLENEITYNREKIDDYNEMYKSSGMNEEQLREKDIINTNVKVDNAKQSIQTLETEIENNKKQLEELKQEGEELKTKEVKVENETCSTCGQQLPKEKIQETLNKLREQQENDILQIKARYDDKKEQISLLEKNLEVAKESLANFNKELEEIKTKKYEVEQETEKQKEIRVRKEQCEIDLKSSLDNLPKIEKEIAKVNEELKELNEKVFSKVDTDVLNKELEEIDNKLATTITLNKIKDDVESKAKELEEKRNNKVVNKDKLQEVIKFNNVKADLLQKKVKNYFNLVTFRTKEFNQQGEEVETFKICNDKNVEFNEINTGHKILLGIDLLHGIMKAKNIYVPMIIDNFESITNDINLEDTQLIIASAIKDKKELEIK